MGRPRKIIAPPNAVEPVIAATDANPFPEGGAPLVEEAPVVPIVETAEPEAEVVLSDDRAGRTEIECLVAECHTGDGRVMTLGGRCKVTAEIADDLVEQGKVIRV
tara:strand:- start:8017 stop:8331 length:315 start_codon:yes stop_codon:yes gene_type:complete